MAKARIPLSSIARDPVVAAFLARGERDTGATFTVPAKSPVKTGGAAERVFA